MVPVVILLFTGTDDFCFTGNYLYLKALSGVYEVWRKPIRTAILSLQKSVLERMREKQNGRIGYCLQLCFWSPSSPDKL
jgi:hypothetical protein